MLLTERVSSPLAPTDLLWVAGGASELPPAGGASLSCPMDTQNEVSPYSAGIPLLKPHGWLLTSAAESNRSDHGGRERTVFWDFTPCPVEDSYCSRTTGRRSQFDRIGDCRMTIDEIWAGDLFDRKAEAEQLIAYLENTSALSSERGDNHAYVLAVDAPYGVGKTFFLRRFAQHVAQTHPVAFIDAWADDLEDQPLVALAATVEDALLSLKARPVDLQAKVKNFVAKAGAVAKIAGYGIAKRTAQLVITSGSVAAIEAVVDAPSDGLSDDVDETAGELVGKAAEKIAERAAETMKERIARFRAGKEAVAQMKAALTEVVAELSADGVYPPPIFIVIDELDRCRPTYAIKLLEEVKHLFDVAGVVFVLGMHGRALGHSVSAAYGSQFDGGAYLQRFITRRYQLRSATMERLVGFLFETRGIEQHRLLTVPIVEQTGPEREFTPQQFILRYMTVFGVTPREAFGVVDILQTCLALTGRERRLHLVYLLPLIFGSIRNVSGSPEIVEVPTWHVVERKGDRLTMARSPMEAFLDYQAASSLNDDELLEAFNNPSSSPGRAMVARETVGSRGQDVAGIPRNYKALLHTVGQFSEPAK